MENFTTSLMKDAETTENFVTQRHWWFDKLGIPADLVNWLRVVSVKQIINFFVKMFHLDSQTNWVVQQVRWDIELNLLESENMFT